MIMLKHKVKCPLYVYLDVVCHMIKSLLRILKILFITYLVICGLLYCFQEKMIFFPEKLQNDYVFNFNQTFEETTILTEDNVLLNGVLFKADTSKGLIFYLHGNAGSVKSWGRVANAYTDQNYDVFMLDYRGYGKSEGTISSQNQMFKDVQTVYENMKSRYIEDKIIVLGYSIGTGIAVKLASKNNPKLLILQAPYYSMVDMMKRYYPIIPTFLLKYKFETNIYIQDCKVPIVIFHGNRDTVIPYESSHKIKDLIKDSDTLIILNGQGHNGMSNNMKYLTELKKILE